MSTLRAGLMKFVSTGVSDPEHGLPSLNGRHRRRAYLPSGARHRPIGLHARHESELDHVATRAGVRAEVLAGAHLGAVLQYYCLCHRYLYQCSHQEEEVGCFEEEGTCLSLLHARLLHIFAEGITTNAIYSSTALRRGEEHVWQAR